MRLVLAMVLARVQQSTVLLLLPFLLLFLLLLEEDGDRASRKQHAGIAWCGTMAEDVHCDK